MNTSAANELDSSAPMTQLLKPSEAFALLNHGNNAQQSPAMVMDKDAELERANANKVEMFGVMMGEFGLLIEDSVPKELCDISALCRLPNTPSWLSGFINNRSNLVPVFCLDAWMQAHQTTSMTNTPINRKKAYGLLIGLGKQQFALKINSLPEKIQLSDRDRLDIDQLADDMSAFSAFIKHSYFIDAQSTDTLNSAAQNRDKTLWCEWDIVEFIRHLSKSFTV